MRIGTLALSGAALLLVCWFFGAMVWLIVGLAGFALLASLADLNAATSSGYDRDAAMFSATMATSAASVLVLIVAFGL